MTVHKKEDSDVVLSERYPGETPGHCLWMAHWIRASSNAEPKNHKNCDPSENILKGGSTKDSAISPSGFMKSKAAERVMGGVFEGVSHGGASVQHVQQFNSTMRGVTPDLCKDPGPENREHGEQSLGTSMKNKDVSLHARVVISKTYSIHKLSQLPLDFQELGSSDNPSSDFSHFPMFEINRKIDNILNPKRRSALGSASSNVNMSASHEYRMKSHRLTDGNMDICKAAGALASHLKDSAGLASDPSEQKLKGRLSDTPSYSCSKDDNDSSDYPIQEQYTSHYFASSKNEKKYNQNSIAHAFSKQDAAGVIYCEPVRGIEFQNSPTNCSNSRKQDNFHDMYKYRNNVVSSSLLPCGLQHFKTQGRESSENLVGDLPDPVANTLTINSNVVLQAYEESKKSTWSCKRKGPCLFEMLTIPSKSQRAYPRTSESSGKSSGFGVCMCGTNIGSHLFGAQNQSSAKTESLYSDALIPSKSSAGIASPLVQKEYGDPNEAKVMQLETKSVREDSGCNRESRFQNVNEHLDVSSTATNAAKQESSMPRTGRTNLDLILFQMGRLRNQISSGVVQPLVGAEPSDRWLKRLQPKVSAPQINSAKRPKLGDSPPVEETSCFFGIALRHERSKSEEMMRCLKEDPAFNEGIRLKHIQETEERSAVPVKSMNSWIGRLCHGGASAFHGDPCQGRQGTKPGLEPEGRGGHFPSIAVLAMMGRGMRPCEHQKRGPLVVWKTE